MTIFIKILMLNSFVLLLGRNDCDILHNGKYQVLQTFRSLKPNSNIKTESKLLIEGDNFSRYWDNGDSAKGKLKWLFGCRFKVDYFKTNPHDTSKLETGIYTWGDECFELRDRKGDTIFFRTTFTGNLHLTSSEGIIIKIL